MKNKLALSACGAALTIVLGACASAPDPNPRLLAAEASFQDAKASTTTMTNGRSAIEKAGIALADAREKYTKGDEDAYTHFIRMGEGYVSLANARGMQGVANAKIASLNTERAEAVSQARKREVAMAEAATAAAENRADQSDVAAAGAVADREAAETGQRAAEARIALLSAELKDYEQKKTDTGLTLILRDLQFASASSTLSSGAQGRLEPLASFLKKQPDARIQIAGHTDSKGSESYNQDLSARRAQSVGDQLISTGIDTSRITTIGLGESVPLSSNATAAGRAINRRVEVTILD